MLITSDPPAPQAGKRHPRVTALRIAVALVALGLCISALTERWGTFSRDLARVGWLHSLAAAPLLLAGLIAGMMSWRRVLAGLGSAIPLSVAVRIYFIGQLGKYVPGSLWPVLAQMELGRDHHIPRRRSFVSLVVAVVLSVATGLAMAGACVPLLPAHYRHELWWLVIPVPFLLAMVHPRILWRVLGAIPKLRLLEGVGEPPTVRSITEAAAWSVLGWIAYGLQVAVLATVFHPSSMLTLIAVSVGGYALAWCAGLVVFLLPAGAGARDLALAAALGAVLASGPALAVAVICRVLSIFGDLTCAAIALATSRKALRALTTHHHTANAPALSR